MTTSSMRRKRESAKRLTWLTEAQAALGWGIILVLVAVLGTIYLSQASQIAVTGRRVQIRQNELDGLKRENAAMEKTIAEGQALERLRLRAQEMGFVPAQPDNIEYLLIPDYPRATAVVPTLPPLSTATPEAAAPLETLQDALWTAFRSSISDLIQGEAGEQ
jgi:hypothetical protein